MYLLSLSKCDDCRQQVSSAHSRRTAGCLVPHGFLNPISELVITRFVWQLAMNSKQPSRLIQGTTSTRSCPSASREHQPPSWEPWTPLSNKPLLRKCALVLFDDILVYSASLEDHTIHLQSVLELLRRDQWQVKRSKCSFAQRQLSYLGHTISQHGVATETPKMKNIANWSSPQSVKEVRSFLGLVWPAITGASFAISASLQSHWHISRRNMGRSWALRQLKKQDAFQLYLRTEEEDKATLGFLCSQCLIRKARHKPKDGQPLLNQDLHLFE